MQFPWQVQYRQKPNPKYPYMSIGGGPLTKSGYSTRSYSTWGRAVEAASWFAEHGVEEIRVRRRYQVRAD